MKSPLFSPKLRLAFILPTLTALAVSVPLTWLLLSRLLQEGAAMQLLNTLPVVVGLVEDDFSLPANRLQDRVADLARESEVRITLIEAEGRVLADSARTWSQVLAMDNHAGRPEVVEARDRGQGSSVRRSATTGIAYVYAATTVRGPSGSLYFVRLAQPLAGLDALRRDLALIVTVATMAALVGMGGWLWWLQRQIDRAAPELLKAAEHLEEGDFSHRIDISPHTELGRLGRFLNRVAQTAAGQILELTMQREHLLTVVSSMREGVLVTDAEGFTRLANQAFCRIFGTIGEVEGRTPLELTRDPQLENLIVRTLTTGVPQSAEFGIESPAARHLAVTTSALEEGSGVLVVVRDITELVRLTRMRSDFVANVSHELKTPLTAIRGYAETLRDGALEEEETGRHFLDRILQQCGRLQVLLEDLLTLSRLESLEGRGEQTTIRLDDLLEDCLDTITPQVTDKQIQLTVAASPVGPFAGDRDALERLVINLLDNAVKYNRPGGSVAARLFQNDGEVVFEVADTGIGIPSAALDRVFERFYRVDKGRSRDEGGTGLGLAIVKHVAQLHGGRVEVKSDLGKGSTFRVHLPVSSL